MQTVNRRAFLKLMGAGAAAGIVQPKMVFAQTAPIGGAPINYINVFLYGGADPLFLFPFLEGPVHNEFTRAGGLRGGSYPRSGIIEHFARAGQGRVNPIGLNSNWSALSTALRTTSCGAAIVTEFGVTESESLSHEIASKQFHIGLPGPDGDPSSFKQGWLASLIDAAQLPAMSVWGMGVSDPVFFNSNTNRPLVLSSLDSFSLRNRNEPSSPFRLNGLQALASDDAALAREFAKQLANQPHPEIPFDAAMTESINNVYSTVGLVQSIKAGSTINAGEFGQLDFSATLQDVARLVSFTRSPAAPAAVRQSSSIICTGFGGWDGHESIGYSYPHLIRSVSEALAGLIRHLSRNGLLGNTVITLMTEFGRTLRENGTFGTDHGRASYAMVLGGPVRNGVLGAEPVLSTFQTQNTAPAEVPFTAILRPVLARAGFSTSVLNKVFPQILRNEDIYQLALFR